MKMSMKMSMKILKNFVMMAMLLGLLTKVSALDLFGPNHSQVIEKLPVEYSDYKTIDNIFKFDNFSVERFKHITVSDQLRFSNFDGVPVYTEHDINKKTNYVIIKTTTKIDANKLEDHFYKLDTDGNIIDSHHFIRNFLTRENTGEEVMLGATFLVNKELMYHTTWPLDGDKTKIPFTVINQDLAWSDDKVNEFYKDIQSKSVRSDELQFYEKVSPTENKRRIRKVYYLNATGKWYVLYGNTLSNSMHSDTVEKRIKKEPPTLFKEFSENNRFFKRYVPPVNITVPYFQRLKYSKYLVGNQNGSGQYMVYTWEGMAYYQVKVEDSVLKFKNPAKLSYSDFGGKDKDFPAKETLLPKFAYYSNPNLKYKMLSVNDMVYIIKNK
jgi:hypothetical protein